MKEAVYNKIGKTYDTTRKADPFIVDKIIELLCPKPWGTYLDIGCGSGNYTGALAEKGIEMAGIDYSEQMLLKARDKHPQIEFYHGSAHNLPFDKEKFDGAICVLATHHIGNNNITFEETHRVMREGFFVIFTATPEQMQNYWLCHYFPKMMERASQQMVGFCEIKNDLENAGFIDIRQHNFFVTNTLQDWFLHAGKYKPEIYLDAAVRDGISTFHLFLNQEELAEGLSQLQADIKSEEICKIIARYENTLGDYMFIEAKKL